MTAQRVYLAFIHALLIPCILGCSVQTDSKPMFPRIVGPWWNVAGNPDLGKLNGPPASNPQRPQEPVDFSIWQAADGTWQLWSCIRNTNCGENTRLFYGWESRNLTDPNWKAVGIAMQAEFPKFESQAGGLQAPHVVKINDLYHMIYGDWNNLIIQRGDDGKTFERWLYDDGRIGMFTEGPGANTRDPMLIRIDGTWHCYYTAYPESKGANPQRIGSVYCRTSKDLRCWSESRIVSSGGQTGTGPSSSECPHVVQIGDWFYLFRTQRYGGPPTTSVYRSRDPLDFGVNTDDRFLCLLPVAAPEIIVHEGEYYIAALKPDIQGIRIARLEWIVDTIADRNGNTRSGK